MATSKPAKPTPVASVRIDYYTNGIEVDIEHFEKLNARKIQKGVEFVLKRWQQLQQRAVQRVRKEENDGERAKQAEQSAE